MYCFALSGCYGSCDWTGRGEEAAAGTIILQSGKPLENSQTTDGCRCGSLDPGRCQGDEHTRPEAEEVEELR